MVQASYLQPLLNWSRGVNYSIRSLVSREPAYWPLYQVYVWSDQIKWNRVVTDPKARAIRKDQPSKARAIRKDTELVIDGFPGSANSFAAMSFQGSQKRPVKLGHHTHAPAQIIKAVKLGIPVLLTVREPGAAVVSLTTRWPYISVNQGLQTYIEFYTKLRPYASKCVISTFDQTTQHLDRVVQAVNTKFGTEFDEIDLSKANTDYKAATEKRTNDAPERATKRKALKPERTKELTTIKNTQLLMQANALYKTFEELAQQTVQH